MKRLLIAALCAASLPSPVLAVRSFVDGNSLYSTCSEQRGSTAYYQQDAYCNGYITGAADAYESFRDDLGMKQCMPEHVTRGQLRDIVFKWLEENPKHRHLAAYSLVEAAIKEAFCPS